LLNVELRGGKNVLVTNNIIVCFPTALSWTRRNGSQIEYYLGQV
jgi:hypothetical protein